MKLTLDWNCIIAVEEGRPQAEHVSYLVDSHRNGLIEVALLAASASENLKSKRFPGNAGLFLKRVAALGWQDLPLVLMPGVIGLSYLNYCFIVGDGEAFDRDMTALWQVIAPKVSKKLSDHIPSGETLDDGVIQSEALSKWRNTWCDVVSAYSHIYAGRDLFVTSNTRDFQDNTEKLGVLGMKYISTPEDAADMIQRMNNS